MNPDPTHTLAESLCRALIEAAESAYEDAGIQGLCAEGRWEAAVSAMRGMDLEAVVQGSAGSVESAATESSPSTGSSPSTASPGH